MAHTKAVGILTDRDVALALAEHPDLATREVGDVMTRGVASVAPGDSLASVAAKFGARGLHRLLVVDSGKMLRGIVAWSDLAPHRSDRAGRSVRLGGHPAAPRVGLGLSLPLPSRRSGDSRTRLPEPSRG